MIRPTLLATCLVLFACDQKEDTKPAAAPDKSKPAPDKGSPEKAAAAPDKAATAPTGGKTGIDAPGNDPKIVAMAKKVLGCKWDDNGFDSECADLKTWQGDYDSFSDNKVDSTLVAFIEDGDEKVRYLGLNRLQGWSSGGGAFGDKAMATRVLTVAEASKASSELYYLGNIVGHVKVKETELFPRIKALVTSTERDESLRSAIIRGLLGANPENDEVFALTRDMLKDANPTFSRAALSAFIWAGESKKAEACVLVGETLEKAADDLAGAAAQQLPGSHCKAQYDLLLKSIDGRVKGKKLTETTFPAALEGLCSEKDVTAAQTKQALGLAHKILEDKKNPSPYAAYIRGSAVDASVTCDPKGHKKYLAKFKKDSDKTVSEKVTRLLAAK